MPYEIVKVKRGYYVQNKLTKRRFSKKPIPLDNAQRQLTVLNMRGEGFIDTLKSLPNRLLKTVMGRDNYSPIVRTILSEQGNQTIAAIEIYKKPVQAFIKPVLNAISFGKFQQLLKREGHDKLFHLYMRIHLLNGVSLRVEKNEVISIKHWTNSDADGAEHIAVEMTHEIVLNTLLQNAHSLMGNKYFTYNAFSNNCQNYVMSILEANHLITTELKEFIYQDMTNINRNIQPHVKGIADTTTGLANRLDVLIHGAGLSIL